MMFVIKALVTGKTADGKLLYRLYRCPYDGPVVQGSRIGRGEIVMCESFFPSLDAVAIPDPY